MATYYQTKGFVLKKKNWFEADQILTIYTKDFGKLDILGKAIRKIKSKLRAGVELFCVLEIEFIQGRIGKTLTDAVVVKSFKDIRKNLEKAEIAQKINSITDNLVKGQEKDANIWYLLNQVFQELDQTKIENKNYRIGIYYYYYFWNLVSLLGYQINLYQCASCKKKLLPEKLYFNFLKKGIICQNCHKKENQEQKISIETVKILRLFLKKEIKVLSKIKITDSSENLLKTISENYLNSF
jgi:DNA repair protein RecO (recombination protein O)